VKMRAILLRVSLTITATAAQLLLGVPLVLLRHA
jgi:hypothetical protein